MFFSILELGVAQVLARDLTFGEPQVNFMNDTVEVQISWLPPISSENFTGFKLQYFIPENQSSTGQEEVGSGTISLLKLCVQTVKR